MDLDLPVAHYRLSLRAVSPIRFYNYSGSAWRGLFGHALKRSTCVTHEKDCRQCLLYRSCVYSYIFETPPPANTRYMRQYNAAPHPFILTPDFDLRTLEVGETTNLDLVLTGKASQYLPYIIHAFEQAGSYGVGPAKGEFEIAGVTQETRAGSGEYLDIYSNGRLQPLPPEKPEIPPLPETVTLQLQSPLRLKYRDHIVSPSKFAFAAIISNLLRRVSMLSYFHNDTELDLDFKALVAAAQQVKPVSQEIKWYDWARYSSRQQARIKMAGIVGAAQFKGSDVEAFWPLLWLGQWLHIGKASSMGLGHYRIKGAENTTAATKAA